MASMAGTNITGRLGAWSAHHWKAAVCVWLGFVAAALLIGQATGMRMLTGAESLTGQSAAAHRLTDGAGMANTSMENVLVQNRAMRADATAFREVLGAVVQRVRAQPYVSDVESPLDRSGAALVSADGHSALIRFQLSGSMNQTESRVVATLDAVATAQRAHPDYRIEEFGDASFDKASNDSAGVDFHRAEIFSIPVTVFILLIAFGALVAAVLPVLLALSAFAAAYGLMLLTSHVFPTDMTTLSAMLLIGLAVGVDYSLFYLRREREERAAGRSADEALLAAASTSGRSVLISGLTVMVAVAGMFLAGTGDFRGIAMGTILVVATSVIGSLTVLPALLSKLGDRIERGRVPFLRRPAGATGDSRVWGAVTRRVMRRPAVVAVSATAILVTLALPLVKMHTVLPGYTDYPRSMPILQTLDRMQQAFPGGPAPAEVVLSADNVDAPAVVSAVGQFHRAALATGQAFEPITEHVLSHNVAVISVPLAGTGQDAASLTALRTLRQQVVPTTLADVPGMRSVDVGGSAAASADYNATMRAHIAWVFAFVLGAAFLLLLATFRSVVIAIKAIVLNLLSVGAAYGFLVAAFQWGWAEKILGFHSIHGIASWIPLFLFVVLFGLSMDYHIFILSRIREAHARGMSTAAAIEHGVRTTAGVVTSAAAVMVVVFAIFASLSQVSTKEIGTGLAVAVLLDATIVRGALLPASMRLLGEWNWWLPRRLSWLPRLHLEHPMPEPAV